MMAAFCPFRIKITALLVIWALQKAQEKCPPRSRREATKRRGQRLPRVAALTVSYFISFYFGRLFLKYWKETDSRRPLQSQVCDDALLAYSKAK